MNVIDRARERIERDGWWQGANGQGPNGEVCIGVALREEECASWSEREKAWFAIQLETGTTSESTGPVKWNDDPSTSLEDVLLVMKRASARLDEEAS